MGNDISTEEDRSESKITNDELIVKAKSFKQNKASGPDGISNLAIKTAILLAPETSRIVMQRCLNEDVFPNICKHQILALLP